MLCPKCSSEMAEGFIDNVKCPVFWKELGYRDNFFTWYSKRRPGRIQLGDGDFLTGGRVSAFYCSTCNLVLINDVRQP